jgi:hypothetical protein
MYRPAMQHSATVMERLAAELGPRWIITREPGGYRAQLRDCGSCRDLVLYASTPGELLLSVRIAQAVPVLWDRAPTAADQHYMTFASNAA